MIVVIVKVQAVTLSVRLRKKWRERDRRQKGVNWEEGLQGLAVRELWSGRDHCALYSLMPSKV